MMSGLIALTWALQNEPESTTESNSIKKAESTVLELTGEELITPATSTGIENGLRYLASQQNPDGSMGSTLYHRNPAVVGLAGLAFLAEGSAPGRGRYGEHINRAVKFLIENTSDNGYINGGDSSTHAPMYGHGFAALFLAEVYGMSHEPQLRAKLSASIRLIINSQNREGGWRYEPEPNEADISVTVCQIMALRAARNAGIFVPKDTVDECIKYVVACQNQDGGFKYQIIRGSPSEFARSAAAVVAMQSAGVYEGRTIERGLRFVRMFRPDSGFLRHEAHYFYGHYYAAQAMWHAGGEHWNSWFPAVRDDIINRQLGDGSWADPYSHEYGTAMACIILQLPNGYLPIFQR